jgi:hypothetical protein
MMVLANAETLLGQGERLTRILLLDATTAHLREEATLRFAQRIRSSILANMPGYAADRLDLAVAAWLGAARNCLEQRLHGTFTGEPRDLATFIVRWNLRGLGLADRDIDAAIDVATRALAATPPVPR